MSSVAAVELENAWAWLREKFDQLKLIVEQILLDKKATLMSLLAISAFFSLPFAICSFTVSGTANAGFNVVLTAITNFLFVLVGFYVTSNSKTPIAIGFLLGVSAMMCVLNLTTAIYWGQLSKCVPSLLSIRQYSCGDQNAYIATCVFAVFLFLDQLVFVVLCYQWRGVLIDETGGSYTPLPNPNANNNNNNVNNNFNSGGLGKFQESPKYAEL